MDIKKLSRGEQILAGGGILMAIDLLFLPWHRVDLGVIGSVSRSGVESPNGLLGVLALLLAVAVAGHVLLSEFTQVKLPALPISWVQARQAGALSVAALLVLKLILETSALAIGAWLGLGLAAAMAYGAYLQTREEVEAPVAKDPETV